MNTKQPIDRPVFALCDQQRPFAITITILSVIGPRAKNDTRSPGKKDATSTIWVAKDIKHGAKLKTYGEHPKIPKGLWADPSPPGPAQLQTLKAWGHPAEVLALAPFEQLPEAKDG